MHREAERAAMRLGQYILENMEAILTEWEAFARATWKGPLPGSAALRNGAETMLRALVKDMAAEQSDAEQKAKSEGNGVGDASGLNKAAIGHALARVNDGFDLGRMVAEFRALRASVNRLWFESMPVAHRDQIDDMGRFNEAVDQLVAASRGAFTERIERSRRLFLAILGHDLRQPLYSIKMYSDVLSRPDAPADTRPMVSGIGRCCDAMSKMLADLLDFTSTRLGCRMPVYPAACDIGVIAKEVVAEFRTSVPEVVFHFEADGEMKGVWDATRLRQLVSNLLTNAVQHGSAEQPVTTTLRATEEEVTLAVHNGGTPIPREAMGTLFDPLVRMADEEAPRPHGSVGLGLYICRQIALAHHGEIGVESGPGAGTTFTVRLPRESVEEPA
jgi:signal transduction histidine kinase